MFSLPSAFFLSRLSILQTYPPSSFWSSQFIYFSLFLSSLVIASTADYKLVVGITAERLLLRESSRWSTKSCRASNTLLMWPLREFRHSRTTIPFLGAATCACAWDQSSPQTSSFTSFSGTIPIHPLHIRSNGSIVELIFWLAQPHKYACSGNYCRGLFGAERCF